MNLSNIQQILKWYLLVLRISFKVEIWKKIIETSLMAQWLRLHSPSAGDLSLIPAQGIRSHMLQLRVYMPQLIPSAAK